ncbi:cysA, partial [Symbiodinium necroappetens]
MASRDSDIVQFCCQLYYAQEGESPLSIDIMRLGSMRGRLSVKYHTVDASALAGREYEACSGELIFEHGEDHKEIQVEINDDDNWSPSTEFKIVLTHPQNCRLGQDLQYCRVKIIDDDAFPGNNHREEILKGEDAIWNISGFSLFFEFFRLNFISEGMGYRTVLTVMFDQLKNAYLLLTLMMKTYLINVVLDTRTSEDRLILPDRRTCAIVIGILYIAPLTILHVWDYYKLSLDVQGRTKMFIQTTLFRKYLNYSEKSRRSMTPAQMNHAITQESTDVASAYAAVLEIVQMGGRIVLMVCFTMWQDPACWWVVALMPTLMVLFGIIRGDAMSKVTRISGAVREQVVAFVSESCDKYSLIAEYSRRPVMSEIFEKKANLARLSVIPEQQVALNNNYFPQWLGPTFIGAYIALFAESVLDGSTSMGVFLAIISVISDMTNDFEGIFIELMSINTRIDSLKVLTHFFNMESELPILRELNLRNRALTLEARQEARKLPEPPPETGLLRTDLMEMKVEGLSFGYKKD